MPLSWDGWVLSPPLGLCLRTPPQGRLPWFPCIRTFFSISEFCLFFTAFTTASNYFIYLLVENASVFTIRLSVPQIRDHNSHIHTFIPQASYEPGLHTGDAQLTFTNMDAGVREAWVVDVVHTSSFTLGYSESLQAMTFHWVLIKGKIKFFTSVNTCNIFPQDNC